MYNLPAPAPRPTRQRSRRSRASCATESTVPAQPRPRRTSAKRTSTIPDRAVTRRRMPASRCPVPNLDANVDDLIDFEYPPPPTPPFGGDGKRNRPDEECDAPSDSSCPGQCGAATSAFPCLCTNRPRERVVEHEASDLDTGWTGL